MKNQGIKKQLSFLLWFLTVLLGTGLSSVAQQKEQKRPNIIFIMSDDHANKTISAYGSKINNTPNIDRIANEGAIFTNSFCANSICGPSRATILTGKHSHKNGVTGNGAQWNGNQELFPRILKKSGYKTALIGKWHLNSNPGDEFDYWKILMGAGRQGFYYNPDFVTSDGKTETVEGYATDIVTDESLKWLNDNGKTGQPFLLFVQYKATHVPRMPHFRYLDKYKDVVIPEPATLFDNYDTRESYAKNANMELKYKQLPLLENHDPEDNIYYARMTKEQLKKWHSYKDPETKEYLALKRSGKLNDEKALKSYAYQQFIKDYLRCVDGIDDNVGKILEWLDQNDQIKENTIIVYASDQSYFTGEHGWAEKRFMYEEGMKMPFIIRWPGHIKSGTKIDALIQNIDFGPTLLDAAQVNIPADMQGKSLIPLFEGNNSHWRKSVYYHYYDHGAHNVPRHDGVRNDRYKLIHFYTDDVFELYDLKKDPNEVNNVFKDSGYKDIAEKMMVELNALRKEYEVPDNYFQPPYVKVGRAHRGGNVKKDKKKGNQNKAKDEDVDEN